MTEIMKRLYRRYLLSANQFKFLTNCAEFCFSKRKVAPAPINATKTMPVTGPNSHKSQLMVAFISNTNSCNNTNTVCAAAAAIKPANKPRITNS